MQMRPSGGFLAPGKRASNLAVFSLSRIFRQTVRPSVLSRAFHTLDMLPWPVRLRRSKRAFTSTRFMALLGRGPNHCFNLDRKLTGPLVSVIRFPKESVPERGEETS